MKKLIAQLELEPKSFWTFPLARLIVLCKGRSYDLISENMDSTTAMIVEGLSYAPSNYAKFLELILSFIMLLARQTINYLFGCQSIDL